MGFGRKGKLIYCFIGPYQILRHIGKVVYELNLANEFVAVHPVLHVEKVCCIPTSIIPIEGLGVKENLS